MTVRVNKPAFNLREKLSELERPIGLKGSELMKSETVQDARDLVSAGRKNLIINGNPIVYQRAQTASNIAAYQYHTADRWRFSQSGAGVANNRVTDMSVVTDADIAGDFIGNYVRIDHTTAATSPASNASVGYNYRMEPRDIVPYLGKEMTLSFYARSNAGIAINSGFVSGTTPSSIILIDSNDSSTWITLTSDWKRYKFTFTLGTTVPSTYLDIGIRHQPGIVGHVDMTGIQLERGRNATEFEHRSYGEELALCQRYYEKFSADDTNGGYATFMTCSKNSNTILVAHPVFRVPKRAPGATLTFGGLMRISNVEEGETSITLTGANNSQLGTHGGYLVLTMTSNSHGNGDAFRLEGRGDTTAYMAFSSEL